MWVTSKTIDGASFGVASIESNDKNNIKTRITDAPSVRDFTAMLTPLNG
jgi:hypothetical protein